MLNLITAGAEVVVAAENFTNSERQLLDVAIQKLEGNEFKVFYRLVQIMDSQYQAFTLIEDLARDCNIRSRTTIIKGLDSLVAMGMVQRLGKKHQGYIYQISQIKNWTDRPEKRSTKSVLRRAKAIAAKVCKSVIQKMDDTKPVAEQPDSTDPLKGSVESKVVPVNESKNCTSEQLQKLDESTEEVVVDLDAKIEAFRTRGYRVGTAEQNGAKVVIVDGLFLSVEEFMQRSVEYFTQAWQPCAEGLAMCWAQLEKAKQRLRQKAIA